MMISITIVTIFVLLVVSVAFVLWRERQASERHAAAIADRAALVDSVQAIAHDLDGIFGALLGNLTCAHEASGEELEQLLAELEQTARAAKTLVRPFRGDRTGRDSIESFEGAVRVLAATYRRRHGVVVDVNITGDLTYLGRPDTGFRIVHNLLANAAREVEGDRGASVRVELSSTELRVQNRVRDRRLDEKIFGGGVSTHGSSGLGLQIVRESAEAVGLEVQHECERDSVTFVVRAANSAGKQPVGPRAA